MNALTCFPHFNRRFACFQSRLLLLALLLTLFTVTDAASNPPQTLADIFRRIATAERETSYVGKRFSISWTSNDSFAREELVVHQPPTIHFIKLLSPMGENQPPMGREKPMDREQWRDREHTDKAPGAPPPRRHFRGGEFFPPPHPPIELMSPKDIELLNQNYQFRYAPSEQIAGHATDLLTIEPRFEGRPTKRLWVAQDKGVILRLEALNPQGNVYYMSVYTQISFQPEQVQQKVTELQLSKESGRGMMRPAEPVPLSEAQKALNHQLILPAYLPQGFQLQNVMLMKFRPEPAVHLLYTDGLMMFSLFESKEKPSREPRSRGEDVLIEQLHKIPVQIMERRRIHILRWFQGGLSFTLIGELSRPEMTRIAESLILSSAP